MEEIKNTIVKVQVKDNTLAVTKGYLYINKDGKERYTYNEVYYQDKDRICRKYSNEKGEFFYNIELVDVVVETYIMKDGTPGSKTYPLSETPYLATSADTADPQVLTNYLEFKLHR